MQEQNFDYSTRTAIANLFAEEYNSCAKKATVSQFIKRYNFLNPEKPINNSRVFRATLQKIQVEDEKPIIHDGTGYWFSSDSTEIERYAERRSSFGIKHLNVAKKMRELANLSQVAMIILCLFCCLSCTEAQSRRSSWWGTEEETAKPMEQCSEKGRKYVEAIRVQTEKVETFDKVSKKYKENSYLLAGKKSNLAIFKPTKGNKYFCYNGQKYVINSYDQSTGIYNVTAESNGKVYNIKYRGTRYEIPLAYTDDGKTYRVETVYICN